MSSTKVEAEVGEGPGGGPLSCLPVLCWAAPTVATRWGRKHRRLRLAGKEAVERQSACTHS